MEKLFNPSIYKETRDMLDNWRGGGHTRETDPYYRGWRVKGVPRNKKGEHPVCWVLGRRDEKGCFSIMRHPDGLDVAYYPDHTGYEVFCNIRDNKKFFDTQYILVADISGWGLFLIAQAEAGVDWIKMNPRLAPDKYRYLYEK